MKKIKVVGYGSLLNYENWNLTIKDRDIKKEDCEEVLINDCIRTWTAFTEIKTENNEVLEARFLDITFKKSYRTNRIAIEVSKEEFNEIKIREKSYLYKKITNRIDEKEKGYDYYTRYSPIKEPKNINNAFIMKDYLNIVDKSLEVIGDKHRKLYNQSTMISNLKIKEGKYRFIDEEINKRTGR